MVNFLRMNLSTALQAGILFADEKAVTFSLIRQGEDDVSVFVFNHPALISVMKDGFEYLWAEGSNINKTITKVRETFSSRVSSAKSRFDQSFAIGFENLSYNRYQHQKNKEAKNDDTNNNNRINAIFICHQRFGLN